MAQLRDRMSEDLKLAGYALSTHRIYLHYAKNFAKHFMRSPAKMGEKEIRTFLLYLLDERKLSHDAYRQCHAALKFLYSVTLRRPFEVEPIPRRRGKRRLPIVLSGSEVQRVLAAFTEDKYRAVTMTIYAAGLRVSEACRLRIPDIDSKRMVIHVREAKGGKDRYVMLSKVLLHTLRDYFREHRPHDILFEGNSREGHVSREAVRSALRRAGNKAGVSKRLTPHILRHSFSTHLMELGTNLRVVQALLGHEHITTTSRYTSVSTRHLQGILSPLDVLSTPRGEILG